MKYSRCVLHEDNQEKKCVLRITKKRKSIEKKSIDKKIYKKIKV